MLAVLALWSLPVLMAAWAIVDSRRFAWLQRSLDDSEGIAVALLLELIAVVGTPLLLPAWGYAIGRSVNWLRWSRAAGRLSHGKP